MIPKRVAIVHDWLVSWRGGEKVLETIASMFPEAPIFTLFHSPKITAQKLAGHKIVSSALDKIPFARERHRYFLTAMPWAISHMKIPDVDLVISSSHCVAKSISIPHGAKHLSYVHAPLRYMYDRYDDYFGVGKASIPVRLAASAIRGPLQKWDSKTASVNRFVANSKHVQQQVIERYRRECQVIYPPVELDRFIGHPLGKGAGGYFLCLGALAPYKRIDLAIEAFANTRHELLIAGSGQSDHLLKSLPKNVKVLGQVKDEELVSLYSNARALIFPGVEDFGIIPLEIQACGRPVIAFAQGGALETVTEKTGLFFYEQSANALANAVNAFDQFEAQFDPNLARQNANLFSKPRFIEQMKEQIRLL